MKACYYVLISLSLLACQPNACSEHASQDVTHFQFTDEIHEHLKFFTRLPHPFGSVRQAQVAEYLEQSGKKLGFKVVVQKFNAATPNPDLNGPGMMKIKKSGQNILWLSESKNKKPIVLIGSHYDTKNIKDLSYVGANDSASSSVAIMNFLSLLNAQEPKCHFVGVWFDGEESVLHHWNDGQTSYPVKIQDNTYGSRHFVSHLDQCRKGFCLPATGKEIKALILLDMIGSKNPKISQDTFSSKELTDLMIDAVRELKRKEMLGPSLPVEDDHIPFIKAGIPALDIIDFENVNLWHSHGDDLESLSLDSMLVFSQIAMKTAIKTCEYML